MNDATLATRIDRLLPQTQCGQCGYAGCRPYAEAIAAGEADIDRCPPGGELGIRALAALLGVAPRPLDPACGPEAPPRVAWIDEDACIGCTKCIRACPVDAIVGGPKRMHGVLAAECTGCALCLPPCPVDCIRLLPLDAAGEGRANAARHPSVPGVEAVISPGDGLPAFADGEERRRFARRLARAAYLRARHLAREARLARDEAERVARLQAREAAPASAPGASTGMPVSGKTTPHATEAGHVATPAMDRPASPAALDRAAVLAAIARGKARREARTHAPSGGVENTS